MNVFVTGGTGFLGMPFLARLACNAEYRVTVAARQPIARDDLAVYRIATIGPGTHWSEGLVEQECVIHLAACAHVIDDDVLDLIAEYHRVNVLGTMHFARQAALAGVRRFIFISSIGVNGNINSQPYSEVSVPNPLGLYAQSKWEAEQALWDIQRETGMEVVIIRPPLVYGPDAPGNFGSLVRLIEKRIPLPFGAIHNQRSLVAVDNLVDLILTCISHPAAANQLFLAGDGQDLSTTELLEYIAEAMGKPSRLIPVPSYLVSFGASLLGKGLIAQKLLGSLQVDISKARDLLGWEPPISVKEGLRRCFVSQECQHTGSEIDPYS